MVELSFWTQIKWRPAFNNADTIHQPTLLDWMSLPHKCNQEIPSSAAVNAAKIQQVEAWQMAILNNTATIYGHVACSD